MRVFVTGGSGYVGAHLVRGLLAHGHELTVLSRDTHALQPLREHGSLEVIAGDLRAGWDESALEGHGVCVHAAILWDGDAPRPEEEDLAATRAVFAGAIRARCPHVLYVSSVAVHRPFAARMTETDRIAPTDEYGLAKASGEALLVELRDRHGVRTSCVRAGPVVGAPAFPGGRFRSDRRITEIVRAARAGETIRVGHAEGRQLTPTDGLARTVGALLEDASAPELVVAIAREPTRWEQIARAAVALLRSASPIEVAEPVPGEVVPRFDTTRLERLLGEPLDADVALREHLETLAAGVEPAP